MISARIPFKGVRGRGRLAQGENPHQGPPEGVLSWLRAFIVCARPGHDRLHPGPGQHRPVRFTRDDLFNLSGLLCALNPQHGRIAFYPVFTGPDSLLVHSGFPEPSFEPLFSRAIAARFLRTLRDPFSA